MKRTLCLIASFILVACATPDLAEEPPMTEEQKTLYALGLVLSQRLAVAEFTEAEAETISAGFTDGLLARETRVALSEYGPKIDGMMKARVASTSEREKVASESYCDAKAKEDGAVTTASGAIYFEVEAGSGASPSVTDRVKLHYHGTLRDGTVFDSSVERGEPATFALNGVVSCFSEGIQQMSVGGKAKLVCPASTAYGDQGSPPLIKPGAAINFEVELLEIVSGS